MRWRPLAVVLAAGALAAPVFAVSAAADPNEARMDELRAAIGEASAEEAAALEELAEVRERREQLDGEVRALDTQIAEARARADRARAERDRAAAESRALSQQIAKTEAEMVATKARFDDATAALYRESGSGSTGPTLLFELNPEELGAAKRYLSDTSADHLEDVRRYLELKDELAEQRSDFEDQQKVAEELADDAEREEARLAELRAEHDTVRQAVEAEEDREAAVVASITARKDQFESELSRLEAESARLREQFSGGSGGTAPGQLLRPVNAPITSGFGPRVHPITGSVRNHNGIDFGASSGTPIKAGAGGTVVFAGWNSGGFGNLVIIDHGGGLRTLYAHQSSVAVGVGSSVSAGQVVGYVGSTGASTGPHLHWEVWVNGAAVNPMNYL